MTYDSFSRQLSDSTFGCSATQSYDDVGNPTGLRYPSGLEVGQSFDALNRPAVIGPKVGGGSTPHAEYGYRGRGFCSTMAREWDCAPSGFGSGSVKTGLVSIETNFPEQTGRPAGRRLVITPETPPVPGTELELEIPADAVRDLFLHGMDAPYSLSFTWPDPATGITVLDDTTPPVVEALRLRDGALEIAFSEPVDLASASSAILVDGTGITWSVLDDGYTLRADSVLSEGDHTVQIAASMSLDLAGLGLADAFDEPINVAAAQAATVHGGPSKAGNGGQSDADYFALPDSREVPVSALINRFAFHGRPFDVETGLYYFRNRYYDPELGRFITADPLGYVDGPSMYQFAINSPGDFSDPLGLYAGETDPEVFRGQQLSARLASLRSQIAKRRAQVESLERLITLRQKLFNEVHPDEWVFTLAQWSLEAGMTLQQRAALQNTVLGPLGTCHSSMQKFACAAASEMAGKGQVLDTSLELVLALQSLSEVALTVGARSLNVPRYRAALNAQLELDDILQLSKKRRPGTVLGFGHPTINVRMSARSGYNPSLNETVAEALDMVPMRIRSKFHTHCAEPRLASSLLDSGSSLDNFTSYSLAARTSPKFGVKIGDFKPPCRSCGVMLDYFKVSHHAPFVPPNLSMNASPFGSFACELNSDQGLDR